MKIVQSLWSKPALRHGGYENYNGHWTDPRFFWYSWVLSTSWAHKHYGNVDLIADTLGAQWLVDKLKLPFTRVRTDLESLEAPAHLWAFGKIIAYDLQDEPFFHIDGDVYFTGRLPQRYEQADLLCQHFEQHPGYLLFMPTYDKNRRQLQQHLPRLPAFWRFMDENSAANCGIFGGVNLDAIHHYTRDVRDLVEHPDNTSGWRHADVDAFASCVIEQQTLWCSARHQGIKLSPLFENTDFATPETFQRKALELNFNHAASAAAKGPQFGQHLGQRVQAEYPRQFEIIQSLFPGPGSQQVYMLDADRLNST